MRRRVLAAGTLLALVGCTQTAPQGTPAPTPTVVSPTPTVLPSSTVTPRATATPAASGTTTTPSARPRATTPPATPRATPTSDHEVPGEFGTLPSGFALPDEDREATAEVSGFVPTIWRATCVDGTVVPLSSVAGLAASRVKESTAPEYVEGHGLLVFADAAGAQAFMRELRRGLDACATEGPVEGGYRPHQRVSGLEGHGDGGLAIHDWTQHDLDGTWVDAPGGGLQYVARQGKHVALSYEAGEYVGDPGAIDEVTVGLGNHIDAILGQVQG